jgi:primosomal protein N'
MKCIYCGRNVEPVNGNCPKCKAKIVRPAPNKSDGDKKEVK